MHGGHWCSELQPRQGPNVCRRGAHGRRAAWLSGGSVHRTDGNKHGAYYFIFALTFALG